MPTAGGVLEKARGKQPLKPGFSLMAWMKLTTSGTDLTGGVGAIDEDSDEDSWKEWTLEEVKQHNTSDDLWLALRGRVYNVTPYLRYHPGGIDILMTAAGTDATALFDENHAWVNAHAMMEACCVGKLCAPAKADLDASATPGAGRKRTIQWDEAGIQAHDAERGVLFGTIKCDQIETPYLYLEDEGEGDSTAINSKYLPTHVPQVERPTGAPGPYAMQVEDLQKALGLLETDESGLVNVSKWSDEFEVQRQELYSAEARIAFLSRGLPDGWKVFMSRSDPVEPFYYHKVMNLTQWERPSASFEPGDHVTAQAAVDISDDAPVTLVSGTFIKLPLKERMHLTHNTSIFRFALPTSKHVLGLPVGQHLLIKLTSADGETVTRQYTPQDCGDGYVDFVIKVYFANVDPRFPDGGKMTQMLDQMQIGDTIEVKGPLGEYIFHTSVTVPRAVGAPVTFTQNAGKTETAFDSIGFIAGGSGITPVLQVTTALVADKSAMVRIMILFANVSADDILCRGVLDELAKDERVQVWYTLDVPPESGWQYSSGFIDEEMIKTHLPPPGDRTAIFMCGPPPMINLACKPNLAKVGHAETNIHCF